MTEFEASPGLWMIVEDVFHIRGRGTVITGQLQGHGQLHVGDMVVCGDQSWKVAGIERFRAVLQVAEPGVNIGVMLGGGPPGQLLQGHTVQFTSKSGAWHSDGPASGPVFGPGTPIPQKKKWRMR